MNRPARNEVAMPIKPKSDQASTAEAGNTTREWAGSQCRAAESWGARSGLEGRRDGHLAAVAQQGGKPPAKRSAQQ